MNDNIVWRNYFTKLHGLQEALVFYDLFHADSKSDFRQIIQSNKIYNKIKKSLSLITNQKKN